MLRIRLVLPNDSPKTQIDGSACTLSRLRASSMQPIGELEARVVWERQYRLSEKICIHVQRGRSCGNSFCRSGKRCLEETMLTGQVLVHWDLLCGLLGEKTSLVRCELNTGAVLVGLMIPQDVVAMLRQKLKDRMELVEPAEPAAPAPELEISDGVLL